MSKFVSQTNLSYVWSKIKSLFVPKTRKINNKTLDQDITLTASDVGALPDTTTIPTVNNGTLTIQKNGTSVGTFTANQSGNSTVNITVPTEYVKSATLLDDGVDTTTGVRTKSIKFIDANGNEQRASYVSSIENANSSYPGLMSVSDKNKLDNLPTEYPTTYLKTASRGTGNIVSSVHNFTGKEITLYDQNSDEKLSFTEWSFANATQSLAGLMSATDKTKLDGLPSSLSGYLALTGGTMNGDIKLPTGKFIVESNGYGLVGYYGEGNATFGNANRGINLRGNITRPLYNGSEIALYSDLLDKIYPIGSIYMSINNTSPASFLGGTWTQIGAGYALWTATSDAGNTISAGLPNITASYGYMVTRASPAFSGSGAGSSSTTGDTIRQYTTGSSYQLYMDSTLDFNASNSNSIYGNSTTVQPPAYKVYAWRRTA